MEESKSKISVPWILASIVISVVLSKFSRYSLCQYLYLSFCWIFLTIIVSQSYGKFERNNHQILGTTTGAIIGWVIGTVLVWKHRHVRILMFEMKN